MIKINSSYRAPTGTTRNPILRITRYEELKMWFLLGKNKDSQEKRNSPKVF
jgi:hypothetical protein